MRARSAPIGHTASVASFTLSSLFFVGAERALQDNPDENAFVYSIRPRELRATTKRLNESGGLF